MKRPDFRIYFLLILSLILAAPVSAETPDTDGFVSLFDGNTLTGWTLVDGVGPGYIVRDGVLTCPADSGGNLFTDYYAWVQATYPRHDGDLVSSHNDLNPRNILFDGKRLWVIDWETAFRNDRYADLASVANFFFRDEPATGEPGVEEEVMLRAYFSDSLDEYHRARFFLMRQVCRMYYAMLLMLSASGQAPNCAWDDDMETLRLREFHRRFAAGAAEPDLLASAEGMFLYGKVWLNEALHDMKSPRFAESVRTVSDRHYRQNASLSITL